MLIERDTPILTLSHLHDAGIVIVVTRPVKPVGNRALLEMVRAANNAVAEFEDGLRTAIHSESIAAKWCEMPASALTFPKRVIEWRAHGVVDCDFLVHDWCDPTDQN